MALPDQIKHEARRLGFQAVGISVVGSSTEPSSSSIDTSLNRQVVNPFRARLFEWLQRAYHGTMAWMERNADRRSDPRQVLPGCRSVISVGINYYTDEWADERPGHGRIARYAWGRDYHDVLHDRLERLVARIAELAPGSEARCYVDTGPIMEKAWAQQAGLGWIGKHSNLVSDRFGSWLLLGEILTTLDLRPDEPGTDLCGSCNLCIQACPTGAIPEPYVLDARKCISYLTIELRSGEQIPEELASKMGNRIFGCDDCLDVCPYNVNAEPTPETSLHPTAHTLAPDLHTLSQMSEAEFNRTFRGSPIRRAKHAGFQRNVTLALQHLKQSTSPQNPRAVPTP